MRILHNCAGQSIVELSLITPLLLVALYIPADFGIAFFTANITQNAVREGAKVAASLPACDESVAPCTPTSVSGATCPSTDSVVQAVCARIPAFLSNPTVSVTLSSSPPCMRSVTVQAVGQYNFFFNQMLRLIGLPADDDMPITRTTGMRYQLQPIAPPCG